ncbi:MAG: tripartite tricarboxylate transporter substrate binding protein [Comamonas sp.]|uniref:Bug family tripartite tricarboxylate transporter substrate binding protein n=1 Tax=Comamonas sp. TaxID=34028 RepID=UPI002FCA69C4
MQSHLTRRQALQLLAIPATGATALGSLAQGSAYPSKPIKIIVPWTAGGGGDALVRAMAPVLAQRLGQPVIIDNRPGAIGTIGSLAGARSPADGYTLIYGTADSHSIAPHILKPTPYDALKAFTAVAPLGFTPLTVMVHASHPAKTLAEFLQLARQAKEPLTYGSWGQGSSGQIIMEVLKQATGADLLHVPYNSTAPLMQAQLGKQIDCAIIPTLVAEQHVAAGTVRMLAITAPQRMPAYPQVPTLKEFGVAIDIGPWLGFLAPARTPADVVTRLHSAIESALGEHQVIESMRKMSMVMTPMAIAAYQQFYEREYARWGSYIRSANIALS